MDDKKTNRLSEIYRRVPMHRRLTCVLFVFASLGGCRETLESTVTGTVTYKGQPVPLALMNFHFQGRGAMAYAMTEKDGTYHALTASKAGLKDGTYRVAIETTMIQIPKRYGSIESSQLEVVVQRGKHRFDIELTDE